MDLEAVRKKVEAALADRRRRVVDSESLIPAAVLLLLTNRGGPHVVFAKRTEDVAHHKGQFSFPGGIVETWDGSRLETALREAQEEIGLPPSAVEILGTLDDTETRATQFVITPFVGLIREPVHYIPDGKEIERVLEVPLAALLDPAIFRVEMWERDGEIHPVYFYEYNGETIWGATARILKQFLDLVFPEGAPR
ncbi:MAG: NUDIX hydrolase [Candidatus Rokubacteria bacterium CSP1-6]|nr:MAG: NUDIX hydrolase [Candidatus Rokubacteria bacterium CSP1-6]